MHLLHKVLLSIFIGLTESLGIVGILYNPFFSSKPVYWIILLYIPIWVIASVLSYYTLFECLLRQLSRMKKGQKTVSLAFLILMGPITFIAIPLYNRIPAVMIFELFSVIGTIMFIISVYTIIFTLIINRKSEEKHPAFSTLLNWLITRVWHSPAALAVFHSLLFSLVFASMIVELQASGIKNKILFPVAFLFIINPVNGIMAVTLWKDIPYSISLLWLTVLALKIIKSEGTWILSRKNGMILAVSLIFSSLVRHNGIIPVFMLIAALFVFFKRYWNSWSAVTLITIAVILLVKGPFYNMLHISPVHPFQTLVNPIMQVGVSSPEVVF